MRVTPHRSGFTLFELLVSISIIGILIALGTVSFTTAQQSGRDSRRRSDVTGMRNALEQYYARYTAYPDACTDDEVTEVLPNGFPTDPKTGDENYGYDVTCSSDSYCVCALMEREGTGNSNTNDCTDFTTSGGDYFCAQNLQ
ncbi:type II secretion system GspH family protein [Candidatus Woesebacteria bacterium]|nr:type II secretion system GspH family protein [Candidatus Woesebacteria bacterium]MCD8507247.1 type II secretion system GspH family protein [Candidatus Woesebacteria bacterium]MCD8526618.1 type II secretion system GspH family protein [Candidatus Woesebacteria bacterium]MCD8546014.1 type II secretion system GspH family protein [Candidatus Woesebacteria bacterium]